ncbi:amino acid acetyltransferase, partial [Streptomyces bobili]
DHPLLAGDLGGVPPHRGAAGAAPRARSLGTLFTATTGGGGLFLRFGFVPTTARLAPASWTQSLDPRRDARILRKALQLPG